MSTSGKEGPLSLERFAELLAHECEYPRGAHPTIWQRLETDADVAAASRAHWARRLGDDLANGDPRLVVAFARTFGKVRRAIGLRHPPPEKVKRDPELQRAAGPAEPARAVAGPVTAEQAAAMDADARLVPSYLKKPEFTFDRGGVTAKDPRAGIGSPAASPQPVAPEPPRGGASPAPPTSPPRPVVSALDFSALPRAASVRGSSPGIDATAMLPSPVDRREAKAGDEAAPLPFVEGRPIEPKRNLAQARMETGTVAPSAHNKLSLPFLDASQPAAPLDLRPEEVDLSLFPLEKFAEITGALAGGERRSDVLARHRLTGALYDVLASAWASRLNKDKELLARFTELARRSAADASKSRG